MKWGYSVTQKTKAAALLVLVFVIVLAKNIIDRNNVLELGDSFSAVYKDRLMAESYIYHFSDHLYQKKLLLATNQNMDGGVKQSLDRHNKEINDIITKYDETKLTEIESNYFKEFKKNLHDLMALETDYLSKASSTTKQLIDQQFTVALSNLNQLSTIQTAEGKKLMEGSQKIISESTLLTKLELAILIIIGLIIQVLIFASGSLVPKTQPRNQHLN
ncbi:MCP four helix bundle domain-containing protein [Solitalea canadensis]|uniref:Chemotaxis methyl-accepting receptor HlyB-like 4HB MCP domain-containing protein n=1 Tax=Solitalea canadensis (strain ATCC 29591 / DSM 3403 / JCM 21819 / LMG 8368 / NBRC 15130 / NCIMB 12057 / USAM 9D) TaxID=929556 RepID=H8KP63_SOLCM|nr:MCP four helix bundle domain-containing protein [Solitalea canadensis]AFD05700.1 hypothetical protein Solca_0570 [Solitalea canadensis DSM 3403]